MVVPIFKRYISKTHISATAQYLIVPLVYDTYMYICVMKLCIIKWYIKQVMFRITVRFSGCLRATSEEKSAVTKPNIQIQILFLRFGVKN